ncbi:hypothetical protein B0T26DRAFT_677193 [Lasiosphaeria miniovina]|uniref:Uncharacterized protein n=1 Tax=Lasiosphaeria miniovina TaxID=1954250 RepID=A0AA40DQV3_9PEZI|nr:uncharacterized protein B0T26DRAFT_677193 [Lasiosphaeria miniovina]KAK0712774.1 hypothetical protein B0T26DRAFT_677193 [Lasiosphaeria miniovina]
MHGWSGSRPGAAPADPTAARNIPPRYEVPIKDFIKSRRAQGLWDYHALSPAKLIEALAFELGDETCWTVLNSFSEIAHPLFTTTFNTPDYIETEVQLPELGASYSRRRRIWSLIAQERMSDGRVA